MRVLWLATNFPLHAGSPVGTYNFERAQALRRRHGIEVKVISPVGVMPPEALGRHPTKHLLHEWWAGLRTPALHECLDGIEVWRPRWAYPPKRWFWRHEGAWLAAQTRRLTREVARVFQPDLLQASRLFPEGKALVRVGRSLGLPVVAVAEGSEVMISLPRDSGRGWLVSELNGGADAIVYVSASLRSRAHDLGVAGRIEAVIHNGVDTVRFCPGEPPTSNSVPVIVSVGNLYKVKGHDVLIKAVGLLASRFHSECKLLIIGDGPEREPLCRLAAELNVAEAVHFVGSVGNDDIPGYLRSARVVCLPSRSEGLPVAAIEAMSCGVPVVATRVGGLPEVLEERLTGILVEPDSPEDLAAGLASAFSQSWDATSIRSVALRRFSIEATVKSYASIYDQVLSSRRGCADS